MPEAVTVSPLAIEVLAYWNGARAIEEALQEGNTALAAVYLARFGPAAAGAPEPLRTRALARFVSLNRALQRALADEVA